MIDQYTHLSGKSINLQNSQVSLLANSCDYNTITNHEPQVRKSSTSIIISAVVGLQDTSESLLGDLAIRIVDTGLIPFPVCSIVTINIVDLAFPFS